MCASLSVRNFALVASLFGLVDASLFLARLPEPELKQVLLAEIEAALAGDLSDVSQQRLSAIEALLRPTFEVLPKSHHGKLDHDGVRYLLNRGFAQDHRWVINGLQPGAKAWDSSHHARRTASMKDHLPEVLQELFERRLGGDGGADLREVAVFAATIEHLVRDELRGRLEQVYQSKQFLLEDNVTAHEAQNLMEVYMICYIQGLSSCLWRKGALQTIEKSFHDRYPSWGEVKQVIGETHQSMAQDRYNHESIWTFDEVAATMEVVMDRYASFYQTWCHDMKDTLLNLEDQRSGRVRLPDFYEAALSGNAPFTETIETLRNGGMLDETDASMPRVIIPNYVVGVSNCVARTVFYSTCCQDACGSLVGAIERKLNKSEAAPEEIVSAVKSTDVFLSEFDLTQSLSPWLLQRLDELAKHHAGTIPLHGRLFAQWMHFVHPRDCIYPPLPGTAHKMFLADLKGERASATLSKDEMTTMMSTEVFGAPTMDTGVEQHIGMWAMEEQLFVDNSSVVRHGLAFTLLRCLALLAVVPILSKLFPRARDSKPKTWLSSDGFSFEKHKLV